MWFQDDRILFCRIYNTADKQNGIGLDIANQVDERMVELGYPFCTSTV
jgi:hypothetical protein